MIFVAGGQLDVNIGKLLRCILRRRISFVDLIVSADSQPRVVYDLRTGILQLNGRPLKAESSFTRHDVFLQQNSPDRSAAPAALNWFYTLKGWELSNPNVKVFNRLSAVRENLKIHNLLMAQQAGLRIPETLVTNDFAGVPGLLPGHLIQKPVAGGELTTTYESLLASLTDSSSLCHYPRFIQPRLSRPELRVYRIGEQLLAFSLTSDDLDYREHQRVTLTRVAVPQTIAAGLVSLCDSVGLDFAAADFMRDDQSGEWCFLEVNSQPMFAAFDDACDGMLCDAMVSHLLGRTE